MSDVVEVLLPSDQSEGTQSHVRAWLKAVGEQVAENEPLLEIETDKVTVEVPAPCDGVLFEILKAADEEVVPGIALGRIERAAASSITPPASAAALAVSGAAASGAAPRREQSPAAVASLSPAVRRLLGERQLSAEAVAGSGVGGRITIDDVLRHVASDPPRAAAAAEPQRPAVPSRSEAPADAPAAHLVPHTRMRKQIATRMVESLLHTTPHVTSLFEIDLTAVLAHRALHREEYDRRGTPLTLTVYFLAACVDALRAVPELNGRWTPEALELYDQINIGVATALADGGLVVPVIRNLAALDLPAIARELTDRVTRAREDRLLPADVRGGTFTISNHGVSGSLLATPIIINQPQTGILGIGKLEKRPVVAEERGREVIAIRARCYVTLTIDHRVLDGQRANQFLRALAQRVEHWET